ncbi:MAG: ATP-binding protein, partial [Candidatus Margulisbacteria bacterium]|nr:ATP-binding protein [Candidatus Margulisiibacteriota bacterium]
FNNPQLENVLNTYNPWWEQSSYCWNNPSFKREYFDLAIEHLAEKHGLALLINGPRRIGKTTLMRQLMEHLVINNNISTKNIFFFSLDDPFIQQLPAADQGAGFEKLIFGWESALGNRLTKSKKTLFCFLDEIQRLPKWELYLKRYVDLRYPVRFVISGSASHTIFRKSLESLLGRLIDISMPPFSFREWVRFHHTEFARLINNTAREKIDIKDRSTLVKTIGQLLDFLPADGVLLLNHYANEYSQAGGFPQLWEQGIVERAQFVDLQYVQRVTLEDLRLIKEIRRPEIFHQFLRYAFSRTGEEYNLEELAGKIKTTRVTLSGALPLLFQTELISKVERFTGKPVRLRTTHAKLYAADTMLYEAITKLPADLNGPEKGRLAETLVFNILRRFAGITDISYFRSRDGSREIDFIVRIGRTLIPIEVKLRADINQKDIESIKSFIQEHSYESYFGILITENNLDLSSEVIQVPLGIFLLLN